MIRAQGIWVICTSMGCALLFMLLPLPMDWRGVRPDIATLTLFYWVLALPHRVGVATAFAIGVAQDLIEGAPLGLSSIGLMLVTLLLQSNYQRIRQFEPLQQSMVIMTLMLIGYGLELWLRRSINVPAASWTSLVGMLSCLFFWVPIRAVLRHLRRYYEVY